MDDTPFQPKVTDVELLQSVYLSELSSTSDHSERNTINEKIIRLYEGIESRSQERGLHHISPEEIEDNLEFMLPVLRAAVSYELHAPTDSERTKAREIACDIAGLEIFQSRLPQTTDRASKKALQLAQDWMYSY